MEKNHVQEKTNNWFRSLYLQLDRLSYIFLKIRIHSTLLMALANNSLLSAHKFCLSLCINTALDFFLPLSSDSSSLGSGRTLSELIILQQRAKNDCSVPVFSPLPSFAQESPISSRRSSTPQASLVLSFTGETKYCTNSDSSLLIYIYVRSSNHLL